MKANRIVGDEKKEDNVSGGFVFGFAFGAVSGAIAIAFLLLGLTQTFN